MKKFKCIAYLIILFQGGGLSMCFSQNSEQKSQLKEIDSLIDSAFNNANYEECFSLALKQLKLSKSVKDSLKTVDAYYNIIDCSSKTEIAISYADSLINYVNIFDDTNYLAKAYIAKSDYQSVIGRYASAMENLLRAESIAQKSNDERTIRSVLFRIAYLKTVTGNYQEALDLTNTYHHLITKDLNSAGESPSNKLKRNHLVSYNLLAQNLMYLNKMDSAKTTLREALGKLKEYNLKNSPNLTELNAEVDYELGNIKNAKKYFIQESKTADGYHLATSYYYLGRIYIDKEEYTRGIRYLNRMDSIAKLINYDKKKWKNAYKILNEAYESLGETESQLEAINNYLKLDSIENASNQIISPFIENNFDKARILREKAKLISEIEQKAKTIKLYSFALIPIALLILYFLILRHKLKKRIKSLKETGLVLKTTTNFKRNKREFPKEKSDKIAIALKTFEDTKSFLDSSVTQESIAKEFHTNSTDLSKYTNSILGVSFSTYLMQIRIQYCIEQLNKDPSLDKYSMTGLATLFGFNNAHTFSRSFTKITGVKPSVFRKSISNN